jgi:hypothetical protein
VCHSHDYERTFALPDGTNAGELDSTGIVRGAVMAVSGAARSGSRSSRPSSPATDSSSASRRTWSTPAKGQVGNADESTNTIDATAIGRFTAASAAGGFAKLQVDFSQKP